MEPLARTAVIIVAYVVSCLAAAIGFVLCFQVPGLLLTPQASDTDIVDGLLGFVGAAVLVWPVVLFVALLPGVLAIAYAESAGKRSIRYFLAVWVVTALLPLGPTAIAEAVGKGRYLVAAYMIVALATAGLAGGGVYWALAGRNSGNWHRTNLAHPPRQ